MTDFQLVSDLHAEFHGDRGAKLLKSIEPVSDTLVVAGDTAPLEERALYDIVLKALSAKFKHVLLVTGNHDYYGSDAPTADEVLDTLVSKYPQVTVLRPGVVKKINKQRFIGATLWFSESAFDPIFAVGMTDFQVIRRFMPWVFRQNDAAVRFLNKELKEGDVVVTHHMPSKKATPKMFERSTLNRYFVHDMEDLIEQRKPAVWCFGHTHSCCDLKVGVTRLLCNAQGYPHESDANYTLGFNPNVTVTQSGFNSKLKVSL